MVTSVAKTEIANYIGHQAEPSEWFTVDQERINAFADCTLDHQFIHIDTEKAKQTPFGSTIAHGFLTLSLCVHLTEQQNLVIEGLQMGINYGFDKIRFLTPVKVGSRIRSQVKILDITEKAPGQFLTKMELVVEIEGEAKPALIAEWLGMQIVA